MNTEKNESLLFANETAIFRIISIAKIVSWILLVVYLISFISNVTEMFQGQMQWPTQLAQWLLLIANLFYTPALGLFYFLALQGVAQGLNLGLDIFYELNPEVDVDEDIDADAIAA